MSNENSKGKRQQFEYLLQAALDNVSTILVGQTRHVQTVAHWTTEELRLRRRMRLITAVIHQKVQSAVVTETPVVATRMTAPGERLVSFASKPAD